MRDVPPDSSRLAQTRADSIRALGAAGWTDDELIAYATVVSLTLAGDGATVERRSRSTPVRTFARRLASQHRQLLRLTDSLSQGRTAALPPSVSTEVLQKHEAEMRRLRQAQGFDLAYVKQVRTTLTEAQDQLRRASTADRSKGATRLLNQAQNAIRSQLKAASELQRSLQGSGARTTPSTKATTR